MLHKRVVVLTVATAQIPHVLDEERLSIQPSDTTCSNVRVQYGFMEDPNVPEALEQACEQVARASCRRCHVLPGARNHHRDAPRGDGHLARETVRPDGAMRFAPRLSSGYHLSAWSNSVYRSRCSDTPRRRSGKSQPRRERAGGSRKAADMHCTMMSDHDLPVVVNPFN